MSKSVFAAADFAKTVDMYVSVALKRDAAIERADKAIDAPRKEFYVSAAVAIMNGATLANGEKATLDTLQAYLIASIPLKARQAMLKAGKIKDIETLPACGETIRSQFYAFKTVVEAGHLDRIVKGEAINTIAREARKAKKAPAKPADKADKTPNTTAPLPPVQMTNLEELAQAVANYRKGSNVKAWRNDQASIARIMADMAAMTRAVEAAVKADAKKAAAPKAKVAKAA